MADNDVIQLLTSDHRKAEHLFEQLTSGAGGDRQALMDQLLTELTVHTEVEEQVVYPEIRRTIPEGDDKVAEGEKEHAEAKQLIARLRNLAIDDPACESTLLELQEAVQHHVEEEENEILPPFRARTTDDQRTRLGADAMRMKQSAMGAEQAAVVAGQAQVDLSGATKEELYEQAKQLGIEGRSKMKKDDLAREVGKRL